VSRRTRERGAKQFTAAGSLQKLKINRQGAGINVSGGQSREDVSKGA
jgi:hypothetical protein